MTRYTIRDFADRCGISVDRLRHFEKMGLIRPERDPLNNYRFYTDYQLLDVQRISLLQSIDVPLPIPRRFSEAGCRSGSPLCSSGYRRCRHS